MDCLNINSQTTGIQSYVTVLKIMQVLNKMKNKTKIRPLEIGILKSRLVKNKMVII